MPKITKDDLIKIATRVDEELKGYKAMLMVCADTRCIAVKGMDVKDRLEKEIKARGIEKDYLVVGTGCNGLCSAGPVMIVQPAGIFYQRIKEEDVPEIVTSHLQQGKVVERLLYKDPDTGKVCTQLDEIKFFKKQRLVTLKNRSLIDPDKIDHYISRGGYMAVSKVIDMEPDDVTREVIASGIRGRSGGGFPAGVKWESGKKAREKRNEVVYVVCNADEGDPGAFMDEAILETDPHSVIEGMIIGAYAIGANDGFVYIRNEYPLALERLKKAISQARDYGLLGRNILGSHFSFDISVHRGAGSFVCGESTALMASMSGRAGVPRAKYVHNVEYGYREKPTVLNNVETWANIPVIIEKGAKWFASIGTGDVSDNPWGGSSGTKVFSLTGSVVNSGLVEVPMGITLREIIFEIGGGIPDGRKFKAVHTGGPSGGCIPESMLDLMVDFDSLSEAGASMGSGGMIVMDDRTCMVDMALHFMTFLLDESCGKCTPCREGLFSLSRVLTSICKGEGRPGDIEFIEETSKTLIDTCLCQLGKSAPNTVLSALNHFRDEYEIHIHEKNCPAGVCQDLICYRINKNCAEVECDFCIEACPVNAISGGSANQRVIISEKCIKCDVCYEVCNYDAVEVI